MTVLPLIILALVQGITEFLPISSSGHLILVHRIFGDIESWENRLVLDVAVHVGTLFSVLIYFRKDVIAMLCGLINTLRGNFTHRGARLNLHLIIASLPIIIAGLIVQILQPGWLLLLNVIALTTLIFGILLWIADRKPAEGKTLENLNFKDAFLIGCAQTLALIPGTSRSGITMTAARFLGYSRTESAHFSLLLAIIAITGAGTLASLELYQSGDITLGLDALLATILAFIAGWASIVLMMKWLERASFTIFAIYRIILGAVLLIILNTGIF
ncbi:MAG TPA: undecaprenyl-diphosphate phosphatase [Alphaproteobacteria bacterium]|nr:MAG: undecaprenyl-diphosphate phosphatase [Rhodospirillales bacterium]HOO81724.1 undecaprenyl-diphosphate phosphatase [Alphaproteobacteria bacterium]